MTKAKMPVIKRPGNTARHAVCTGHWTDHRDFGGTVVFGANGGIAA